MSKIKLYIATTLDGFIAREDGSLDWLYALPNPNQIDHGYQQFLSGIDVIVMGKSTYEEVLGFGIEWPYANCQTYILTSDRAYKTQTANTHTINHVDELTISKIKKEKNIWLLGGGKAIVEFINRGMIDEMILCMIPIVLGKGIKLFRKEVKETNFELMQVESFETGVVNLTYKHKKTL